MHEDLATRRTTYARGSIDSGTLAPDPFAQFGAWLAEALAVPGAIEPNAMSVSTVGDDGRPSARIVLLRAWDERGFVFYSNYESRKGHDVAAHPVAALLFWWGVLECQIRIEGRVSRVSDAESDAYFARRPRGHQVSAWASPQSRPISRDALLVEMAAVDHRFPDAVPRPPYWGGFRVEPDRFEFWQGRPDRAHDRILYERAAGAWTTQRLGP